MTKSDIVLELRRMASALEAGETLPGEPSDCLEADVVDALATRLGLEVTEEAGAPPTLAINGYDGASLMAALEAFVATGVLRIEVHPAHWPAWARLCEAHRVDRYVDGAFAPTGGPDDKAQHRAHLRPFEPCGPGCPRCRHLLRQWGRPARVADERKGDPRLN